MTNEIDIRMALLEQKQDTLEAQSKEMRKVVKNNTEVMREVKEMLGRRMAIESFILRLIAVIATIVGIFKGLPVIFK